MKFQKKNPARNRRALKTQCRQQHAADVVICCKAADLEMMERGHREKRGHGPSAAFDQQAAKAVFCQCGHDVMGIDLPVTPLQVDAGHGPAVRR